MHGCSGTKLLALSTNLGAGKRKMDGAFVIRTELEYVLLSFHVVVMGWF